MFGTDEGLGNLCDRFLMGDGCMTTYGSCSDASGGIRTSRFGAVLVFGKGLGGGSGGFWLTPLTVERFIGVGFPGLEELEVRSGGWERFLGRGVGLGTGLDCVGRTCGCVATGIKYSWGSKVTWGSKVI